MQNSTYYAFGKNRAQDKKFVFARSLRIGVETPFGNTVLLPPGQCPTTGSTQCIPLPEFFLSGGGNSHRGFGLNQAGPRDPVSGFPVGGGALFLNNLEMRFPPLSLPFVHDNVSLALFHDAGNVFTTGRNMLDNLLRWKQKNPGHFACRKAPPRNVTTVTYPTPLVLVYATRRPLDRCASTSDTT